MLSSLIASGRCNVMGNNSSPIDVRREVLLIEIDRHCSSHDCAARNRIGLTKQEALGYLGFECFRCKRWNDDYLRTEDIPEQWRT